MEGLGPFPALLGSSLLFWALVPLGFAASALLVRRAGSTSLPTVYLAPFLLAALPVALVYQKYFDPFALLAVALLARPPDLRGARRLRRRGAVCAASSPTRSASPASWHRIDLERVDHEHERLVRPDRRAAPPRP